MHRRLLVAAAVALIAAAAAPPALASTAPRFTQRPDGPFLSPQPGIHGVRGFRMAARAKNGLVSIRIVDVASQGQVVGAYPLCHRRHGVRHCPQRVRRHFLFKTTRLANGVHAFYVQVRDTTGRVVSAGPYLVSVYNRGHAGLFARLTAALHQRRHHGRQLAIRDGTKSTLKGHLADAHGDPLAGALVNVYRQRRLFGNTAHLRAALRTDDHGDFTWPIPPGPSRDYTIRVPYGVQLLAAARVHLAVRARVRARPAHHVIRGAHRLRVRGRVTSGPRPGAGLVVLLQARHGRRWQTFASGHSGGDGRFSLRYRFVQQGHGRFVMRALVPRQARYPYAPGASDPFRVRLR